MMNITISNLYDSDYQLWMIGIPIESFFHFF